jgi:hypothetical protein
MHDTALSRAGGLVSVGTRISWSAILAGNFLAMGIYLLLASLGTAVGLSISEHASPTKVQNAAVIWTFLITCAALFVGGVATSIFTAGENKVEAVLSGVIMWALLFTTLMILAATGIRAGFTAMQGSTAHTSDHNVESEAAAAGVAPQHTNADVAPGNITNRIEVSTAATKIGWYVFFGTWSSMLAAAAGAFIGAGPTLRINPTHRVLAA